MCSNNWLYVWCVPCKQSCPFTVMYDMAPLMHAQCFAAHNMIGVHWALHLVDAGHLDDRLFVWSTRPVQCRVVLKLAKRNESGLLENLRSSLDKSAFIKLVNVSLCAHEWGASFEHIPTLNYLTGCRSGCYGSGSSSYPALLPFLHLLPKVCPTSLRQWLMCAVLQSAL